MNGNGVRQSAFKEGSIGWLVLSDFSRFGIGPVDSGDPRGLFAAAGMSSTECRAWRVRPCVGMSHVYARGWSAGLGRVDSNAGGREYIPRCAKVWEMRCAVSRMKIYVFEYLLVQENVIFVPVSC
jgi:hypothetical protein